MGPELALAFSAGMVATVNPCGFAMLPAYLAYYLGLGDEPDDAGSHANPVLRALKVSTAVTLGFLVVFAIMGVVWSSVSELIATRLPYFTGIVGIGLVILGVAMLRGFEPVLRLPKLNLDSQGRELSSMFVYGVSYAVASLSCTIPIFIAIVSTTLSDTSFAAGVATFVAYGLGMGTTLAVLTLAVALARTGVVKSFRKILPYVNRISGVLLIVAGLFVTYYAYIEVRELNMGDSSAVVTSARGFQSSMQRWVESVGSGRLLLGVTLIISAAVGLSLILGSSRRHPMDESDESDPAERPEADLR